MTRGRSSPPAQGPSRSPAGRGGIRSGDRKSKLIVAVRHHHVQLSGSCTGRRENDQSAIWRKGGLFVAALEGQALQSPCAIGVHHVDLRRAATVRNKGDFLAVGRPGGARIDEERGVGQLPRVGTVGVRYPDLAVFAIRNRIGDLPPIP